MKLLAANGLVSRSEYGEAKSVLDAAALTYLAAAAGAILQLLYYIMLVSGMGGGRGTNARSPRSDDEIQTGPSLPVALCEETMNMRTDSGHQCTLPAVPPGAKFRSTICCRRPGRLARRAGATRLPSAAILCGHLRPLRGMRATAIPAIPKTLGTLLDAVLPLAILDEVTRMTSADGRTTKLLFRTPDGCLIEGVLMHYRDRSTACISSQAGCATAAPSARPAKMGLAAQPVGRRDRRAGRHARPARRARASR